MFTGEWPVPQGQWGYLAPGGVIGGANLGLYGAGLLGNPGFLGINSSAIVAGGGGWMEVDLQNLGAGAGEELGFGLQQQNVRGAGEPTILMGIRTLFAGSQTRFFAGFTDLTLSQMISAANPLGNYVGISYDTSLGDGGDGFYRFVRCDGVNPTVRAATTISTLVGIAYVHQIQYLDPITIRYQATNLGDMTQDLSEVIAVGNVPTSFTPMAFVAGFEALDAGVRSIRVSQIQVTVPLP